MMSQPSLGTPRFSPGGIGDGKEKPVFLGLPASPALADDDVTPQAFGTNDHPFTTVRADAFQGTTNKQFPFRASGKLFFNIGTSTFVCSASLIKRGIVVTAAHCIAEFGVGFHSNWQYVPGYKNGVAPFGTWTAANAAVVTSYLNGTDNCATPGIVCENDVGVISLNPQAGRFAGTSTGFYGFGVNGFGFTSGNLAHITQIGYPGCLDSGGRMERNDSFGFVDSTRSNNTIIGSLMCGGSSGGPWLVNFGKPPTLTGTSSGSESTPNIVVGVAGWGFDNNIPKEMGASPFTSGNIGVLATILCGGSPNPC
jgi:V8-like Glu-specific endopeptidase